MRFLKKLFPFVVILGIWQLCGSLGLINRLILPAPSEVFVSAEKLIKNGQLLEATAASVKRVAIGFFIAALFGVSMGTACGYFRKLSGFLTPLFEFLRPIPPIAWIPIAILWFGLGNPSAYFIVFVGAFFPIFINTYWGIRSVQNTFLNVAHNFGAGRLLILADVVLPGSLPSIVRGLRIGLGLAWTSVISAELVGAQSGLGYMIQQNRILLRTQAIVVGMVTIGIMGFFMNYLMALFEKRLTFWNRQTLADSQKTAVKSKR